MTYEHRLVVIGLAAFAAAGLAGAVAVPWLWRRLVAPGPAARAAALTRLRLLPTAMATCAALLALTSFLLFEPRTDENTGSVLIALAVVGAALLGVALIRWVVLLVVTRRTLRGWLSTARPTVLPGASVPAVVVTSSFPIVAVIGVRHPRLVIAQSVLDACSPAELRAILAHEQGHLDRRDNLRRALLTLAPDVLSWLPVSDRLLAAWHEAAEEAADDVADRLGANGRIDLAQALIKVARLAQSGPFVGHLPASALYRGENIDRRVRRLIVPPVEPDMSAAAWRRYALALLLVAVCGLAFGGIQDIVEAAVTFLP
jgi:Zn-dependent protease with chaperone function